MPVSGIGGIINSNYSTGEVNPRLGSSELGYQDFITLLTAQLKNQSMFEPANDTEFIAQMAQFSSLQQINRLTTLIETSQAISLVGKNIAAMTAGGNQVFGVVESVSFVGGSPRLLVGDKLYQMSDIVEVTAGSDGEAMEV